MHAAMQVVEEQVAVPLCKPCMPDNVCMAHLHSGTTAGVAAGVPVVGILTSQTEQRMLKAGCSLTVKDYRELEALAKQHDAEATNGKLA